MNTEKYFADVRHRRELETMNTYTMINFYAESIDVAESSRTHHSDMLTRIFCQLEENFGVTMEEENIRGLSGAVLQRWMNGFKKDHKPATVNNYVVTLNPFLRWAHTIYPEIPDFSGVLKTMRLPDYDQLDEEDRPKEKYYANEDVMKLLEIPEHDSTLKKRDRAIIALFLGSGLRVSELCSLKIGSLTSHGHGYVYVKRKGGKWKVAEVAEFAYGYIETYLATRQDRDDPEAPLFMTTHGTPCNRDNVYNSLVNREKKVMDLNVYQKGCHSLRHTFVSSVEKIGGGAVARDLANHKSLTITNRYDHSNKEQRRAAIDALKW